MATYVDFQIQVQYCDFHEEHTHTFLSCASISREGKSPKQTEIDGITQERIITTPLKQYRGEMSSVQCQWGWQRPRSVSRDHVCSAIIRQEGFQKGSTLIMGKHADSTWKRGTRASIHPRLLFPRFFALPKLLKRYSSSSTHQQTVVGNIKAWWNEAHH